DEGFDLTGEETAPMPAGDFGAKIPVNPGLIIDTPKAKELIKASDGEIVSVRSWSEWIGEVSGYNYIEKKGRIPGAVFGNCGTDAYHMENYRNLDHTTKEYHEISETWKEAGITPDKHLAFYCGTGWRGSEAFFNAWLMGWPNVSVYDGGWFEWSNDPDNPVERGIPANQ
ncbi:MAG: rhodanese-like domain-containing protein, partial [Bacteroidales bacterium]